jgi:aminoglycoside phosphotransferase (APT) family kinase protein
LTRKPDIDTGAAEVLLREVFGTSVPVTFRRTPDGVSTQVYRVRRGAEVFYLRIAEEPGDNLETEAELHRRLRGLGVQVADIVHVEPFNAGIGRSTLITTEVAGVSLAEISDPAIAAPVAERAGADLAIINGIPVDGFGFVRRADRRWPMPAEYPDYQSFLVSYLPRPWPGPLARLFDHAGRTVLEDLIAQERARPGTPAVLQHGDFDVTAIFCAGGRYTGLIDFGEIRGAEPWFDLGHFHLHDRETSPSTLLPALLRGYQQVRALPADHLDLIRRSAILLALRQLCRWLGPPRNYPLGSPAVTRRVRRINELIGQPVGTRNRTLPPP